MKCTEVGVFPAAIRNLLMENLEIILREKE